MNAAVWQRRALVAVVWLLGRWPSAWAAVWARLDVLVSVLLRLAFALNPCDCVVCEARGGHPTFRAWRGVGRALHAAALGLRRVCDRTELYTCLVCGRTELAARAVRWSQTWTAEGYRTFARLVTCCPACAPRVGAGGSA